MKRCPTCGARPKWPRAPKKAPLREPTTKARKATKATQHRAEMAAIMDLVMDRADGRCEHCGAIAVLQADHMLGGSGRRRQRQSFLTVWALCPRCHRAKTDNLPSAVAWRERMHDFLVSRGYPVPRELR